MKKLLTQVASSAQMNYLSKLLEKLKSSKYLLSDKNACFICGFTKSEFLKIKKLALEKKLIEKKSGEYHITDRGRKFLKNCPYKNWQCSTYPMRPALNLEFLKSDRVSSNITRYIKEVQRCLLDDIKPEKNSLEDFIIHEILDDKSAFIDIKETMEKSILSDKRVNLETIFEMYQKPPYGLNKSIICLLVSKIIAQNKDKLAIFEKDIFVLNLNINIINKIYYCPQNFEIQKTVFEHPVIKKLSLIITGEKSSNILELTRSLMLKMLNLDKYTLNTKSLSKNTIKFRNIILSSKDPINLFKSELPLALCKSGHDEINDSYCSKFQDCLLELQDCYTNLLDDLRKHLYLSFECKNPSGLKKRFEAVKGFVAISDLIIICTNLPDKADKSIKWIEKIAAIVNKKRVPKDWNDEDVANFKLQIKELANKFLCLESTLGINDDLTIENNTLDLLKQISRLKKNQKNILIRKIVNN